MAPQCTLNSLRACVFFVVHRDRDCGHDNNGNGGGGDDDTTNDPER